MEFKRNKKYFSLLKEEGKIGEQKKFVCENPLFINDDLSKGLFPVYRTGGRQGVLNKNYHELIYKDISDEIKAILTEKPAKKEDNEFRRL
tara:strand:- start:555 stop:824 length:270 start_codon:yes stop_codon:yes gene_type:complete